ncbi:MAG: hypothetical protein LBP25_01900 [Tannerellaceae bacterium]|jgi:hypothetical protein|nr:hypothetical protein [Tannerellaceae bacterium]
MKNNLKSILLLSLLLSSSTFVTNAQTLVRSGLLLNGGTGSLSPAGATLPGVPTRWTTLDYRYNLSAGYRFRLQPSLSSRWFLDLDANAGLKQWDWKDMLFAPSSTNPYDYPVKETSFRYLFISAGGTVNHPVVGGLSIGAGAEAVYYRNLKGEGTRSKFDLPLVGKIAYDFGPVELGLQYKYGLMNAVRTDYIGSSKVRDWQVSVFIPF